MRFGEPHPFPKRGSPTRLSASGQQSYEGWSCRLWLIRIACWIPYFTYLLTHSMVQGPSWAANWFAASQEIPRISRNPKVHYRTHKRPPPLPVHQPQTLVTELMEFTSVRPLLQWKSNKHYTFQESVCSLRYPECNAPYRHLWPARLHKTFSTLSHTQQDFIKEDNEHKTCFPLYSSCMKLFSFQENLSEIWYRSSCNAPVSLLRF